MKCYLSRSETFSAAHRLNSLDLTPEENLLVFGKCNHPNYHGHNYTIKITVCGEIDNKTGMVITLDKLKDSIANLLTKLDHKNLDLDVEFFKSKCSTVENLCVYCWQELHKDMGDLLYKVKVTETAKNSAHYMGE